MQVIPKQFNKKDRWMFRWMVGGYTVAVDRKGDFGCSCPVWKFRRQECKHITEVKQDYFRNILKYAASQKEDDENQ